MYAEGYLLDVLGEMKLAEGTRPSGARGVSEWEVESRPTLPGCGRCN